MEALVQSPTLTLEQGACLTGDELSQLRIFPAEHESFMYNHYVLYQKGNKRIILKPLPHNLYKVVRAYDFIPA